MAACHREGTLTIWPGGRREHFQRRRKDLEATESYIPRGLTIETCEEMPEAFIHVN